MEKCIIFSLIFGFVFGADEVLQLDQGKLTGSSLRSRNGREFKAFQGIPYAKSPIGDLRFKVKHKHLDIIPKCFKHCIWWTTVSQ